MRVRLHLRLGLGSAPLHAQPEISDKGSFEKYRNSIKMIELKMAKLISDYGFLTPKLLEQHIYSLSTSHFLKVYIGQQPSWILPRYFPSG